MSALTRLTARDRRALLLGLAVLAPVLVFRGAVQPYARARAALAERLRTQRGLLERELAVLAAADGLPERRERMATLLAADAPRLFPGGDPLAATAELVGYVGDAARRSHLLVQELQSRSVTLVRRTDGLAQVQVEVRGQSDFEGALAFLQALERGTRLVRVDALALERASASSGGQEILTLRAGISGYVAAVAPVPSGPAPLRVRRTGL
ncbi:MAG TPA: GspMb/PilO family protein [Gemmatimonadales bacterium]|nr:GspMb/PilO family protein [Gemmatimonadales bacterium]